MLKGYTNFFWGPEIYFVHLSNLNFTYILSKDFGLSTFETEAGKFRAEGLEVTYHSCTMDKVKVSFIFLLIVRLGLLEMNWLSKMVVRKFGLESHICSLMKHTFLFKDGKDAHWLLEIQMNSSWEKHQ